MEYELSYHLACGLELNSGRKVILESIQQHQTYAGLMEGAPIPRINDTKIESVMNTSKRDYPNTEPYLIPPERRDFLRQQGDMDDLPLFFNQRPEWLPMVCCVGKFRSIEPAKDLRKDGSYLPIVWYQNEFALPIQSDILLLIQSIDWNSHATDYDY